MRRVDPLGQGAAIVVDIGKTHSKVSLWSRNGQCLEKLTRTNQAFLNQAGPDGAYTMLDTAATADWVVAALAQFAAHPIEAIIPVTHGAAVAGVCQGASAFAPPDYEWAMPDADLAAYRRGRDAFALTGSPALPAGLNFGAQLHHLEALGALDGAVLMPYAQYWAWLLSGEAVSEVTSLGCHSDLWSPAAGSFSPMARRRGWAEQFAPLVRAGDAIGTLRSALARQTGLAPTVRIHAGLHDSNAALIAARAFPQIANVEATVLSTGTWFIALRYLGKGAGQAPLDLATLPEARDCLVNVDVFGQPVPSARFMGGRELELLGARIDRAGTGGLEAVLQTGAMILPAQVPGCGPFPDSPGGWLNRPESAPDQAVAAALYAALMADAALDLIGARENLLIEGRFAASEVFTRALASLRPGTQVFTASAEADVSFGALRLIWPDLAPQGSLASVAPLEEGLTPYRDTWYNRISAQG